MNNQTSVNLGSLVGSIVLATFESLLQAVVVAFAGFFLARRGIMGKEGAKLLSALTMKVTLPCLLFSQVLPAIDLHLLARAWPFLLLPIVFVGAGAGFGWLAVHITRPSSDFSRGMIACVAFGNATALPIVVLSVIEKQIKLVRARDTLARVPTSSELEIHNPLVYVSIYLVLYPALQFIVGGWLLKPASTPSCPPNGPTAGASPAIATASGSQRARSMRFLRDGETQLTKFIGATEDETPETLGSLHVADLGDAGMIRLCCDMLTNSRVLRAWKSGVLKHVFTPPVVGICVGIMCSVTPPAYYLLCGSANMTTRLPSNECPSETAYLGSVTSGIQALGDAAVPVQLLLLGNTMSNGPNWKALPLRCCVGVVVAKMVVMPIFACALCLFLDRTFQDSLAVFEDPYDQIFYVAAVSLAATPTANTIVMLTELSGGNSAATATAIFAQYAAAPVVLTFMLSSSIIVLHTFG